MLTLHNSSRVLIPTYLTIYCGYAMPVPTYRSIVSFFCLIPIRISLNNHCLFCQPLHTQQFNVPGIGEINLSFLASPQSNVNLLFDKNQKSGMSGEIKPQQVSQFK